MSYSTERDAAIEAALEAGRLIRFHAGRVQNKNVRDKGTHDLVTEIDERAQEVVVETLTRAFPSDGFLAEEGEDQPLTATAEGRRWIIDPIDGTTNFMNGVPPYAVSIALQDGAEMAVGVVYDVSRDELFTAVQGGGLYVNGRPARVSGATELSEGVLTTGFPYREFDQIDPYMEAFTRFMQLARGMRRPGSASVDLAYVACGRFDGFFETGLYPWDVAAGMVLVREAGGRVTNYRGENEALVSKHILASNGALHDPIREVLVDCYGERLREYTQAGE